MSNIVQSVYMLKTIWAIEKKLKNLGAWVPSDFYGVQLVQTPYLYRNYE